MGKLIIPKITQAEREAITPDEGELIFDDTVNKTYEGDGTTVGGNLLGSGEINTNSDAGSASDGEGLVNTKVNLDTPIKRIKAGTGISVTSETNDLVIANTITAGEVNTNSNAATPGTNEAGLVNTKSGVDTPIKIIKGGSNVTVVQNANDVTISSSGGGGTGVTFLSTQAEYDAKTWAAGDIFIPTANGIISPESTAIPATVEIELLTTSIRCILKTLFGSTDFFSFTGTTIDAFVPRTNTGSTQTRISGGELQVQINNSGETTTSLAAALAVAINNISLTGTTIGSTTVTRQCVASSSGSVLKLTNNSGGSAVTNTLNSNTSTNIFAGEDATTLDFLENRQYVRRSANNGWLVFTTATQDFIET